MLQEKATAYGIDTSHFAKRSPWRKYPDEAIAAAAATSTTLREVAVKLGAPPATGTLSHIVRRMAVAGIDISHFRGMQRIGMELPFTAEELAGAAASADSVRGTARALGVPDDSRSRAALGRMLKSHGIDTAHFRNARILVPEDALRAAVPAALSYADLMRVLGLPVNDVNHRRVRRLVTRLGLDVSHFKRRTWATTRVVRPRKDPADTVLTKLPEGRPASTAPVFIGHCKRSAFRMPAKSAATPGSGAGGRSPSRSITSTGTGATTVARTSGTCAPTATH